MRCTIPQITWHGRDPVLSLDFDPKCDIETNGFYRIATGGASADTPRLLIWHLKRSNTLRPELTCVAELTRHQKAVNVVRFSPDGRQLASGDSDGAILIWKRESKTKTKETWLVERMLKRHIDDVIDLSWSPDSRYLISGSTDNSAVFWEVNKGKHGATTHTWSDHDGFVSGVAYDPLDEMVATICTDRIFNSNTGKLTSTTFKYPDSMSKRKSGSNTDENENIIDLDEIENILKKKGNEEVKKSDVPDVVNRIFHDDELPTYCRRLQFSPRGEILMVPSGILPQNESRTSGHRYAKNNNNGKFRKPTSSNNAVVIFCRNSFNSPCAIIPTGSSYSVAVRFSPICYQKERAEYNYDDDFANPRDKNERVAACVGKLKAPTTDSSLMNLPYRLIYAIATSDSVIIGDTSCMQPLAVVKNIHCTRLTDISWTSDGTTLICSSTDGYCSIISFDKGELGNPYIFPGKAIEFNSSYPASSLVAKVKKEKVEVDEITPEEPKVKKENAKVVEITSATKDASMNLDFKCRKRMKFVLSITADGQKDENGNSEVKAWFSTKSPIKTPIIKPQKNTLDNWVIKRPRSSDSGSEKPAKVIKRESEDEHFTPANNNVTSPIKLTLNMEVDLSIESPEKQQKNGQDIPTEMFRTGPLFFHIVAGNSSVRGAVSLDATISKSSQSTST